MLTLYTTPVIYLLLDKLHRRLGGAVAREQDVVPAGKSSPQAL
jgi:multidrug efflux pump